VLVVIDTAENAVRTTERPARYEGGVAAGPEASAVCLTDPWEGTLLVLSGTSAPYWRW
jgi:hypothetical protein